LNGAAVRYPDGREVCQANAAGDRLYPLKKLFADPQTREDSVQHFITESHEVVKVREDQKRKAVA
jgi:hypothetical protein